MKEFVCYLLIDENGDYVCSKDDGDLGDAYDNDIGEGAGIARRIVKVTVKAALPVPVEVTVTAPDEDSTVSAEGGAA